MLAENSEIANELLDNSPDAMLAFLPKDYVFYWNKGAENTLGYSRDEAIGGALSEPIITADRVEELPELLGAFLQYQAGRQRYGTQFSYLQRHGGGVPWNHRDRSGTGKGATGRITLLATTMASR